MANPFVRNQSFKSVFFKNLVGITLWVPVLMFVEQHVVSVGTIEGRSMKPAFNPETNMLQRDRVLLWKWNKDYKRGDVVILR